MRENIKLGITLFIITAVAGILLGFAYEITKEPIERQEKINSSAVGDVIPGAKEPKKLNVTIPEGSVVKEINEAYDGDKLLGHTMKVGVKGFHGDVEFILGVTSDGKIGGIKILTHSETPGLGANIEKDSFKGQFVGKSIDNELEVVKTGASADNQIDAISGASISSNAVTNGINEALKTFKTLVKGEAAEPEKTKDSLVKEIVPNVSKLEGAGVQIPENSNVKEVDKVFEGDKHVGYAFRTVSYGYHEEDGIELIIVISLDDKIQGIRVLSQSETAGLGAKIEKDEFTAQFAGKSALNPLEVVPSGAQEGQFDAVAAATKSSNGVAKGVNAATEFYRNTLKGKGGN